MADKPDKKPISIRDVDFKTITDFNDLCADGGYTRGECFKMLVDLCLNKLSENIPAKTENIENQEIKIPDLIPAGGPLLSGNQFIVDPDPALYKNMRRAMVYLVKKGQIDKSDPHLPETFTKRCIAYTIKNEYQDILK